MELNIQIENFKSVKLARLPLRKGLNILIGPNGSGKTCLLSSLKFLGDVLRFGAAQALARSGGAKRVYHRKENEIAFAVVQDYGERVFNRRKRPFHILWEIRIAQRGPEKIATIILETFKILAEAEGRTLRVLEVKIDRRKRDHISTTVWLSRPDYFGRDLLGGYWGGVSRKSYIWERILPNIRKRIKLIKKDGDVPLLRFLGEVDWKIGELYRNFTSLDEYSIVPDIARKPTEQVQFARMQPDGGAVSEVIHALEHRHFHKIGQFRQYIHGPFFGYYYEPRESEYQVYDPYARRSAKRLRKEIEQVLDNINREMAAAVRPIESVGVEIEQTTGKRGLVFHAGKNKFYPEEVSDGTMKWLCILVSILVSHSSVYLLEEPENFLHPWMQQRLISMMRDEAKRSGTIFILASHSSTILNAAKPDEVLVVKHSGKETQLSEIGDRTEIERVLADSDFRLGDLWVSGAIGGMPADE